jgi:Tol biopolymer transport system component
MRYKYKVDEKMVKPAGLFTAILLTLILISTLACSDGNKIIDLCDGTQEFLSIPEGADIIFTAGMYGEDLNSPPEIYAMDIDDKKIYRISCTNLNGPTCAYSGPNVSPDKKKMVVMRGCSDSNGDGLINFRDDKSIWIIDIENDTITEIPGFNAVNSPCWSVNNEIVFAASVTGNIYTDIYKMNENGENIQNLTSTDNYLENDPSWSKDGKRIVYIKGEFITPEGLPEGSYLAAKGDLWVMDSDGGNNTKFVSFAGDEDCPSYSDNYCLGLPADPDFLPDENGVVYEKLLSTDENKGSGRWNIFSASLNGLDQNIKNLTNDLTAYQAIPRASQEGIIFHETDIDKPFYGLVMVDLNGSNRKNIIDNSNYKYYLGSANWLPQ